MKLLFALAVAIAVCLVASAILTPVLGFPIGLVAFYLLNKAFGN